MHKACRSEIHLVLIAAHCLWEAVCVANGVVDYPQSADYSKPS